MLLSTQRFAVWAVVPWLLLLLGAFAGVQYLQHADYVYLVGAMVVIVVSAGCILRQAWALTTMRVLAVALALWALISGVLVLRHWGEFERARQQALAMPQLGDVALLTIDRMERALRLVLVFKAVAIPLFLWFAWKLGQSSVRAQFHTRRRRQKGWGSKASGR